MAIGNGPEGFPVEVLSVAPLESLGFETLDSTDLASAVGLTVPTGATMAIIQCEAQNVRWRDDGVSPTSSVGMLLTAGSELTYDASGIHDLEFIRVTAGAILMISYFK